jgi:hypothetical protein
LLVSCTASTRKRCNDMRRSANSTSPPASRCSPCRCRPCSRSSLKRPVSRSLSCRCSIRRTCSRRFSSARSPTGASSRRRRVRRIACWRRSPPLTTARTDPRAGERRPELARVAGGAARAVPAEAISRGASPVQPPARMAGEAQLHLLREMHPGVAKLLRPTAESRLVAPLGQKPQRTALERLSASAATRVRPSLQDVLPAREPAHVVPVQPVAHGVDERPAPVSTSTAAPFDATPRPVSSDEFEPHPERPHPLQQAFPLARVAAPQLAAIAGRAPKHALARVALLRKKLERLRTSSAKDERRVEPTVIPPQPVHAALQWLQQLRPRIPTPAAREEHPQLIDQVLDDARSSRRSGRRTVVMTPLQGTRYQTATNSSTRCRAASTSS